MIGIVHCATCKHSQQFDFARAIWFIDIAIQLLAESSRNGQVSHHFRLNGIQPERIEININLQRLSPLNGLSITSVHEIGNFRLFSFHGASQSSPNFSIPLPPFFPSSLLLFFPPAPTQGNKKKEETTRIKNFSVLFASVFVVHFFDSCETMLKMQSRRHVPIWKMFLTISINDWMAAPK